MLTIYFHLHVPVPSILCKYSTQFQVHVGKWNTTNLMNVEFPFQWCFSSLLAQTVNRLVTPCKWQTNMVLHVSLTSRPNGTEQLNNIYRNIATILMDIVLVIAPVEKVCLNTTGNWERTDFTSWYMMQDDNSA